MPRVTDVNFQPNEKPERFRLGADEILVEVENSMRGLYWRMTVNGVQSHVYGYYEGILVHEGYGLITDYFDNGVELKAFRPFKITPSEPVSA